MRPVGGGKPQLWPWCVQVLPSPAPHRCLFKYCVFKRFFKAWNASVSMVIRGKIKSRDIDVKLLVLITDINVREKIYYKFLSEWSKTVLFYFILLLFVYWQIFFSVIQLFIKICPHFLISNTFWGISQRSKTPHSCRAPKNVFLLFHQYHVSFHPWKPFVWRNILWRFLVKVLAKSYPTSLVTVETKVSQEKPVEADVSVYKPLSFMSKEL